MSEAQLIATAIKDSTRAYINYLKEKDALEAKVEELTIALKTHILKSGYEHLEGKQ